MAAIQAKGLQTKKQTFGNLKTKLLQVYLFLFSHVWVCAYNSILLWVNMFGTLNSGNEA